MSSCPPRTWPTSRETLDGATPRAKHPPNSRANDPWSLVIEQTVERLISDRVGRDHAEHVRYRDPDALIGGLVLELLEEGRRDVRHLARGHDVERGQSQLALLDGHRRAQRRRHFGADHIERPLVTAAPERAERVWLGGRRAQVSTLR